MKSIFGSLDHQSVEKITIGQKESLQVDVLTYGATISNMRLQGERSPLTDVVLGFDTLSDYINHPHYFGATIGRYANRIANGRFTINKKEYSLSTNLLPHHLHGGQIGYDKVIWDVSSISSTAITLEYVSSHMEEGFPGTVVIQVTFEIKNDYWLSIVYSAHTDQTTHINLTNHSYFNLNGAGTGNILEHSLVIDADLITQVDAQMIPTGKMIDITGTYYDFKELRKIGDRIMANELQKGYDHNYVVRNHTGELKKVASLYGNISSIVMDVHTTEPGLHLYTGNGISNIMGKRGIEYNAFDGVCFETQHFPDSPNQPLFPSTLLHPEEDFISKTEYRFSYEQ